MVIVWNNAYVYSMSKFGSLVVYILKKRVGLYTYEYKLREIAGIWNKHVINKFIYYIGFIYTNPSSMLLFFSKLKKILISNIWSV